MSYPGAMLWRTAYEVDFTAQTTQDLKGGGDGNKTIDGKTWLLGNSANCTSIDVTNGVGIVFVASATITGYYEGGATRNAPNLTLPISSALALYDLNQNAVRVVTRIQLTNADTAAEGGKLFMEYVSTPANQNAAIAKWFNGGAISFATNESHAPTFTNPYPTNSSNGTDDLLGLVFIPDKGWQAWSGLLATGDKMRLRNQRGSFKQAMGAPAILQGSDVRLGLCQVTNNNTASLTTTFTHMRVDFCDLLPAI